jgi:hypothetical protein
MYPRTIGRGKDEPRAGVRLSKKKKSKEGPEQPTPERWQIVFFQRHASDDRDQAIPGQTFLENCPDGVAAKFVATLDAVRDRPPPAFSGGGKWEAMHDEMSGYYEVRCDGPGRRHYRLFCLLERDDTKRKLGAHSIVVICGMTKAFRTTFSSADYASVRQLGDEYTKRMPRSVAR